MAERKVVNKYYPPDFDPARIRRARRNHQQIKVRMMLPMTIRCTKCGTYIYKGTKFNSRKEDVIGETYLGVIQIFRFYLKCTSCLAEISIITDPKNSTYLVEAGAAGGEDQQQQQEQIKKSCCDSMKSLEKRTLDSKKEMEILSAIDELKSMKSRHSRVTVDSMLQALHTSAAQQEQIKIHHQLNDDKYIPMKRKVSEHNESIGHVRKLLKSSSTLVKFSVTIVKKSSSAGGDKTQQQEEKTNNGLELLCHQYDDNSSDHDS